MARHKYQMDEEKIDRFIKEKRGQGEGENYKPWLQVDDIPSLGRVHRVFCTITGRVHHFLSDNEYLAFLLFWWDDDVIDIREQFPLNRIQTLMIAADYKVKHPMHPQTKTILVVTTDFLITKNSTDGPKYYAYAVKPIAMLDNKRILEKLQIEREYWRRRGIDWKIITDVYVRNPMTKNLAWIYDSNDYNISAIDSIIHDELINEQVSNPYIKLSSACANIDMKHNYKLGRSLLTIRKLLAAKIIRTDLSRNRIQNILLSDLTLK